MAEESQNSNKYPCIPPAVKPRAIKEWINLRSADTNFIQNRIVSVQPELFPEGKVFVIGELGPIDYVGERPKAGDHVLIIGDQRQVAAQKVGPVPAARIPIFQTGCRCKCPDETGTAFYMVNVAAVANIIAVDVVTGAIKQLFGMAELGFSHSFEEFPSIAVDQQSPFSLYVLDDLRNFITLRTDAQAARRGYFRLVRYSISGGQYVAAHYKMLPDPYVPGPNDPIRPGVEPDAPVVNSNALSVITGVPHITMRNPPCRILKVAGDTIATITLKEAGAPYHRFLRGNVITITDKPGKKTSRYIIASSNDINNFELLEFDDAGDIKRHISLSELTSPVQLASVCNRLLILDATARGIVEA